MHPTSLETTLQLTRIIPATRQHVYEAWSDLEQSDWWGPDGCTTLELTIDVRVGGIFRWKLRAPDGEEMIAEGRYQEIIPNEKLAYTWQWLDDPDWDGILSLVTVEFRDHREGTE